MASTLFLLGVDESACESMAGDFSSSGWETAVSAVGAPDAVDRIAESAPVACIFCLDSDHAGEASELAQRVASDPRLSRPLLVFAGGSHDEVARVKSAVPYAVFVRPDEVDWVLRHLVAKT